jgi:hypothetical protein
MHEWGDKWFEKNGESLYEAISYCMRFWKRWGRIGSHGKEKWGTFRDHTYFWNGGIHGLLYPGYVRIVFPTLYRFDLYCTMPFMRFTRITKLVWWWQSQVYNYAIQKMCKKYPNIIDELVSDLEGYKMIKPGIFGKVDGVTIHNKYWVTHYKDY